MKKTAPFILILTTLCLCSCTFNDFSPYTKTIEVSDNYQRIDGENYYKPAGYELAFDDVYQSFPHENNRLVNWASTGEQKLLVIPVEFDDYTCKMTKLGCQDTRKQIQNAFFGKESHTQWESVASFYNESSLGKLIVSGEVTPWYASNVATTTIVNDDNNQTNLATLLNQAIEWAKSQVNITDYDTDKDGFIDAVCFVYTAPARVNSHLWAYKTSVTSTSNKDDPQLKSFVWASQSFMNIRNAFSRPETRTYIHEVGHLLGLDDYYPTDSSQNYFPLGKMDMMDINIGDHNVFSKMLLNWTRPYVVTGDATISIKPSYLNGDCILVKNNWNGSAMDEYLLLEFYQPRGINAHDAKTQFISGNQTLSLMNKSGIKIYHVDARYAYYKTYSNAPFIGYENDETQKKLQEFDEAGQLYYRKIAATNTYQTTHDNNILISIIEPNQSSAIADGGIMNNALLHQKGSQLDSFLFHDSTAMGYTIIIDNITDKLATISFRKI